MNTTIELTAGQIAINNEIMARVTDQARAELLEGDIFSNVLARLNCAIEVSNYMHATENRTVYPSAPFLRACLGASTEYGYMFSSDHVYEPNKCVIQLQVSEALFDTITNQSSCCLEIDNVKFAIIDPEMLQDCHRAQEQELERQRQAMATYVAAAQAPRTFSIGDAVYCSDNYNWTVMANKGNDVYTIARFDSDGDLVIEESEAWELALTE